MPGRIPLCSERVSGRQGGLFVGLVRALPFGCQRDVVPDAPTHHDPAYLAPAAQAQLAFDGLPAWAGLFDYQLDRAEVDAQVAMHDHIAKPGKFAPRDLWHGALDLAG